MASIRILFLSDTHLGFDLPVKPRTKRRRRGIDFFKNYEIALQPAFSNQVDLVIHGGDLFYRSRIPKLLINMAFEPLIKIAECGIPVFIVAGNHERSFVQQSMFDKHKNIHVFNQLQSIVFKIRNINVQITGFPCIRKNIRNEFGKKIEQINYSFNKIEHIHILCMHQAIEGAQVGIQNYTFRTNHDTIKGVDIPGDFAAILSGHIHRRQVLIHDLNNSQLKSNVYYSGSIERTSFAEKNETKGYLILECEPSNKGGEIKNHKFVDLPSRPMQELILNVKNPSKKEILNQIIVKTRKLDANSILRLKIIQKDKSAGVDLPKIEEIRRVIPDTININYKFE